MRAVGVADGVRTPQFGEFLGLFGKILFTGQREAAGAGHECSFVGLVIKKLQSDEFVAYKMTGVIAGPGTLTA
ncbi:hypothetical protein MCC00316_09260 [Bifidobacterium longum subsp. longum]|uniref:Uncharacterized protein n=1 Tax=Bifidobacterium longum subsp. longum TaxID=1679 RepID=A0AAV4L403_BIFLL|nr:hypothetical protein MCC00316_09260 [Bifidobacterium longum subsp. longum]